MLLRSFRLLLASLLLFAGLVGIYLLTAFACSRITVGRRSASADVAVYIKTNGVHTDIVMPVRTAVTDWSQRVRYDNTASHDTGFALLAVGWGDKGFYLYTPEWKDLKFSTAFRAAFGLSTSAIHATYYRSVVEGERCRKIMMSVDEYRKLVKYIESGFRLDNMGQYLHIITNANYGSNDAFYDAVGSYSLFRTCNTWANGALKACGQECCLWTIFDTGIFRIYK